MECRKNWGVKAKGLGPQLWVLCRAFVAKIVTDEGPSLSDVALLVIGLTKNCGDGGRGAYPKRNDRLVRFAVLVPGGAGASKCERCSPVYPTQTGRRPLLPV